MNLCAIGVVIPNLPVFKGLSLSTLLDAAFILLMAGALGAAVGAIGVQKYGGRRIAVLLFACITVVLASLLLIRFGCTNDALKGITVSVILLYASYSDIRRREVDNSVHAMVLLSALIGMGFSDIPRMLTSAVMVSIPTLMVCIICKGNTVGGADLKLAAACAFLLGMWRGFFGLTVGLLLGIIINVILNLKDNTKDSFPLVPYLAVGFMTAYFI